MSHAIDLETVTQAHSLIVVSLLCLSPNSNPSPQMSVRILSQEMSDSRSHDPAHSQPVGKTHSPVTEHLFCLTSEHLKQPCLARYLRKSTSRHAASHSRVHVLSHPHIGSDRGKFEYWALQSSHASPVLRSHLSRLMFGLTHAALWCSAPVSLMPQPSPLLPAEPYHLYHMPKHREFLVPKACPTLWYRSGDCCCSQLVCSY